MVRWLRPLVVVAVTLVVTLALPAAGAPLRHSTGSDPVADAKRELDRTTAAATDVASRYSQAQTEQAQLDAQLVELKREIPALRARADELRAIVRRRAAELYKGAAAGDAGFKLARSEDVVGATRGAHLTEAVTAEDNRAAAQLRDTATRLDAAQLELEQRSGRQRQVVADLERLRGQLEFAIVKADAAYQRAQAMAEAARTATGEPAPVVATGASVCPIRGAVVFTNDFGAPRDNGARRHQGNDLFSAPGTPNVAAVAGTIRQEVGGLGGNAVWLDGDDRVSYYYAHLEAFFGPPRRVTEGEVVGFTGDTGNAAGGAHHTHFELHPGGAAAPAVNPYAVLRGLCGER